MVISSQHSEDKDKLKILPTAVKAQGKEGKLPGAAAKVGIQGQTLQTLIKLPRHSLLPKDLLLWTIPLFLLWEKQEGNCPRTQGDPSTAGGRTTPS